MSQAGTTIEPTLHNAPWHELSERLDRIEKLLTVLAEGHGDSNYWTRLYRAQREAIDGCRRTSTVVAGRK